MWQTKQRPKLFLGLMQIILRTPKSFFCRNLTTNTLPATSQSTATMEKIHWLATQGHLDDAFALFSTVDSPHSPQTYATLFHACARYNYLNLGRAIHDRMLMHSTAGPVDLYNTNHLINMYAKCGDLTLARQLFDQMAHRNIFSWTSLVSGYSQHGKREECFNIFSKMLAHFRPNDFAYTSVLSVCDCFCGMQVHAHVLKTGFETCVYVGNALITMYWKKTGMVLCGIIYADENEDAWKVFNKMEFRNLVTWNSMIAGFQMLGQCDKALTFFTLMLGDGQGFDRATLVSLLSVFSATETDYSSWLKSCFQLHSIATKSGFVRDIAVMTAVLKAYATLGGNVVDCRKLFSETIGHRDVVLWTEIIAAFTESDPVEALLLFTQFHREGQSPDCHIFSIVLKACGRFVTDKHALAVYSQVTKTGLTDAIVLQNSLIHALSRCGSIVGALQIFNGMRTRDIVSWNSMLKAYALHGQTKEALNLFEEMDVEPDASTFVALLSACSHVGLVKEGTNIFNDMFEKYGIVPQLDHYACMVDILARAGHLLEALKIIRKMPMEPDSVVWSALLGACRKHGESKLANFCVSKLRELDPESSLGYVLMSNIYCSTGSFGKACVMRKKMEGLGIKKEPGLSWTEIGNQVHEFASGGKGHALGEVIRANTKKLIWQLKELGYVPETTLALHDIEEEQKEEQLYYHSEKLAFVFALMYLRGRNAIRIMKNIRICLDCHNFMKLASKLVQREIVVRDSNRFHNFQKGICSCNDYW